MSLRNTLAFDFFDGRDEAIASSADRLDVRRSIDVVGERRSHGHDRLREGVLGDGDTGPDVREEIFLRDDDVALLHEMKKQIECAPLERYELPVSS